jgi:hypothetical protein
MISVLSLYYNFNGQKAKKKVSALEGVSLTLSGPRDIFVPCF